MKLSSSRREDLSSTRPFLHVVIDGAFSEREMQAAAVAWPSADWHGWHGYDSLLERKRTCSCWTQMPPVIRDLMAELLLVPVETLLREYSSDGQVIPDTSLWGAGLNDMRNGDHLDVHLDHDRHPHTHLERYATGILYLGKWKQEWGGELELWPVGLEAGEARIAPGRGRLVIFRNADTAYHAVAPVTAPAGIIRMSLTVFWYRGPLGVPVRPRAQFVAAGSELAGANPAKEALRHQRRSWL